MLGIMIIYGLQITGTQGSMNTNAISGLPHALQLPGAWPAGAARRHLGAVGMMACHMSLGRFSEVHRF